MSNILIIKHGSLGDIAQASGAIQDIFENNKTSKIHILTTAPYIELFKKNPFIHNTILDKRLSRFNLIYLYSLMKNLRSYNFVKVFDLQNSSRTSFYKKILLPKANYEIWSSSTTTLGENIKKVEFDKKPVLERFNYQLEKSNIKTKFTMEPNFNWACVNIDQIKKNFNLNEYIIIFPFCSPHLSIKKWPYYNELIDIIKKYYKDKYKIIIAPGPLELNMTDEINAEPILDGGKILNIFQLASLIKSSSLVIANDTGPAHMAAHLSAKGLTLFGKHTTAHKVSIERENFKAIQVEDLNNLSVEKVFERMKSFLN